MRHIRPVPAPPSTADPTVLQDLAQHLSDGALHCRAYRRHDWRPATVSRERYGYRRTEACTDCGTTRWQELDSRGYIIRDGVHYAEGYLNPKGTGRVGQDGQAVYRLEGITRYLPKPASKRGQKAS